MASQDFVNLSVLALNEKMDTVKSRIAKDGYIIVIREFSSSSGNTTPTRFLGYTVGLSNRKDCNIDFIVSAPTSTKVRMIIQSLVNKYSTVRLKRTLQVIALESPTERLRGYGILVPMKERARSTICKTQNEVYPTMKHRVMHFLFPIPANTVEYVCWPWYDKSCVINPAEIESLIKRKGNDSF